MRKIIFCIIFVITIPKISAENVFDFSWNLGNIGVGVNYSPEYENIELTGSVINLTFEHKDLNIGFELNPIKCWLLLEWNEEVKGLFSFINANIYWDLIYNKSVLLGPFASINYMYINTLTGINMNDYIFSGGLRFSYKLKERSYPGNYNSQLINIEIGYRNITGKSCLYSSLNFDLILALFAIGSTIQ